MNSTTRRKRRLLRSARRGPWGKGRKALTRSMVPVYAEDGSILYYRLVVDPWYMNRTGIFHVGSTSWRTKAGQQWLKSAEKAARWDVDHALSDCCGWGNSEPYHDPYEFVGSIVPARPRMPGFKEHVE